MKFFSTQKIGQYHTNYCEDALITAPIGHSHYLFAVMDGCSMGTDSHMISTIIAKHLRAIAATAQTVDAADADSTQVLKEVMAQLFAALQQTKAHLQLKTAEMLATVLLCVLDLRKSAATFICIGDGLIVADGQVYEYDQDNKPDYLGYHLDIAFEEWFARQTQVLTLTGIRDFSICTDGVTTFCKYDNKKYEEAGDAMQYLLMDTSGAGSDHMLQGKVIELEREWGLLPADDIAIIRVMI
ncbi:protein phosphatase 2C domain-containing protein [Chitinophaga sp. Hz27]|uniref:protein phosphatase 2C domain-containing protein n=1 Tax=Chitinophaga sp. Hz27 TaxID=3347169 RepID=UPI0035DD4377